jgi:glucosamine 6-phosphate synthetase-like amidotransferase/phosphosugar isomerase protein
MFDGEARKIVENKNHKIRGETDSEIICHLLEELIKEKNSIAKALKSLEDYDFSGSILLLTRNYKIYGLRDSSHPLVIAKKNSMYAIGSTEKAVKVIIKNPEKVIEPKPYQVVKLSYKGLRLIGKGKEDFSNLNQWLKINLKNGYWYYL